MSELGFWLDEKAINEDGQIEGIAAGYGNVDFGGDVVLPGAITKSIADRSSVPMLLFHDQKQPVGVWTKFEEQARGLKVKGRFAMSTGSGREAYALVKDGAIAGLSIGYTAVKERFAGKVRELVEIVLHEVSLVSVPMNPKMQITGVKEIEDLRTRLAAGERLEIREWERLLKKSFGLSNAEAERAVRLNLKGQGDPGGSTAPTAEFVTKLRSALG